MTTAKTPNMSTAPSLIEEIKIGDDWMRKVNTFYVMRDINLGSPIIKKMFQRSYMRVNRDGYFMLNFAEYLVKDKEAVKKISAALNNSADKAIKKLENRKAQLLKLFEQENIEFETTATRRLVGKVPLLSPLSSKTIQLFSLADELHALILCGWMHTAIPENDQKKMVEELKNTLRVFMSTVRSMMGTTLNAIKTKQEQGELSEEVSAEIRDADEHIQATADADLDIAVGSTVDAEVVDEAVTFLASSSSEVPVSEIKPASEPA